MEKPLLVLVTGQPGSGKSTLARQLAAELGLPVLAKDRIKESLADALTTDPVSAAESAELGAAAFEVIFGLLDDAFPAIAEASWSPSAATPRLLALGHVIVEIHCSCAAAVARRRYIDRATMRHPVHRDADRFADEELWSASSRGPIGLPGSIVIEIDTEHPVDVEQLRGRLTAVPVLRAALGGGS